MKIKQVWETIQGTTQYDGWEMSGTEEELVAAAYDRKEMLRGEEHWMVVDDVFHLFTDDGKFIGEFSL